MERAGLRLQEWQGPAQGEGCHLDAWTWSSRHLNREGECPWPETPGLGVSQPPLSQQAMNTLHELQFAREFKMAMREAYPKLLLTLLTQVHYVLELSLPSESQPEQRAQEATTPSPQR